MLARERPGSWAVRPNPQQGLDGAGGHVLEQMEGWGSSCSEFGEEGWELFQKTRRSEKVKQRRFQDRCRVPKEGVFAAFGLAVGSRREVGGQARRGRLGCGPGPSSSHPQADSEFQRAGRAGGPLSSSH